MNTFVYIDDILTASDNEKERLETIEAILKRIQDNGMKISLKKSSFGLLQINYLGYTIDFHGIKPNQDKISALEKKQTPKTAKEVKSFMGAASYFCIHIPNFARIAEPLYRVTNEFIWTAEQETAFQNIKKALINAACLKKPDSHGKYEIQTDASNQGIGAVLIQDNRPVAFIFRSLTKSEKNYPPIKLEAIALIYALRTFKSYIYGKQTQVYTDHKPLLALIKNKNLKGILERFQLAIMEFDVKIDYVKGPDNHMADYLSRETFNLIAALDAAFPVMQQPYDTPYNIKNFIHYYTAEDNFKYDGKPLVTVRNKNRFYVPEILREELLLRYHKHPLLGSHFGYQKCAEYFQRIFCWPEMIKDMKSVWEDCSECLANKEQPNRKIAVVKKHLERPNEIFKTLSIDYGVIEEGKYVLAVVDEFTKFAQVAITTNQGALTTTTELMKMFCNFGFPQTIRSDNGPTFKSTKFVAFLKELGIQHLTSSAHHHKGKSIAERFIR
uniref:RNA-directed DNA polymerase n=1 Tax=Strongyloides papillosus TaxID=174720 RepID=A0A0N5BET5_STREA